MVDKPPWHCGVDRGILLVQQRRSVRRSEGGAQAFGHSGNERFMHFGQDLRLSEAGHKQRVQEHVLRSLDVHEQKRVRQPAEVACKALGRAGAMYLDPILQPIQLAEAA